MRKELVSRFARTTAAGARRLTGQEGLRKTAGEAAVSPKLMV
jgi:hypothetical protein